MAKREELKNIKSKLFSRGLTLAKWGLKASAYAAQQAITQSPISNKFLIEQMEFLRKDLGELKGSLMKAGQLLSMYGEHFLPKEANDFLKELQSSSAPLAWPKIKQQLEKELTKEKLAELEIDTKSFASASLGQVHIATRKSDGKKLAVKIQYPGVDKAIDNDLKILKTILKMGKLLPKTEGLDPLWEEIRLMLHQEVDYRKEAQFTDEFYERLKDDNRYVVPKVFHEYSSERILTTEFIEGVSVDDPQVLALPIERRNKLGASYLDLYFRELLEFEAVQTDPHLGNYRIQIDANGNDRLVLLDFGAVRCVPKPFLTAYLKLIRGAFVRDPAIVIEGGLDLQFLLPDDPIELLESYVDLCFLITEPFAKPEWKTVPSEWQTANGDYDWAGSDLPKRVAKKGADMIFKFKLRAPPKELIFLDRKLGGAFVFLSVLNCKLNGRPILERRLS